MPECTLLWAEVGLGAMILAGVLWTGLAGLTIALVVLMWTRFGHAKPLSKCIALSIYAHVLLMTYAYGTKLVIPTPPGDEEGQILQLNLLAGNDDDSTPSEFKEEPTSESPMPWDMLPTEAPPEISLTAPQRADTQVTAEEAQSATAAGESAPALDVSDLQADLPPETTSPPAAPLPMLAAPPAAMALPAVERPSLAPTPELAEAAPMETMGSEAADESAVDPAAQFQELTEMLATAGVADALSGPRDTLAAARNELVPSTAAQAGDAGEIPPLQWINRELIKRPPRRLADGEPVPELYRLRVAPDRRRIARRLGATKESDQAIDDALRWLSTAQSADGRWSAKQFGAGEERKVLGQDRQGAGADADTGITGLALLAMLGAGHTHLEGPYRENVQKGLEYLVGQQKADGSLAGEAKLYAMMYCHGMASLALSEAFAMTGDQRLQPYVEKAGGFSLRSQHSTTGGWRYLPGDQGDMSQFGWQVMALKSAEMAGVAIPTKNREGMHRFLHNTTSGQHRGLASYRVGERPSRTMTAEAFACRVFLGLEVSTAQSSEAARFVMEELPLPASDKPDFYYWYYGSIAMFQLQDERWQAWNQALQKALISRQQTAGELSGSYDTNEVWSGYGGRIYTTAMATLCLEVYYRYLPIYSEHE